jgi:hypothetical protein
VEGSYLEGIRQNSIIFLACKLKQKIPCSFSFFPGSLEISARFIGVAKCFYSVERGVMVADESLGNKITYIVNRDLRVRFMRSAQKLR